MDENNNLNEDINELVDRAIGQANNDETNVDTNDIENSNSEVIHDVNKFNGYFHERDSLSENNIVDEVKTSFLEYSMSVITSREIGRAHV